MAAMWICDGCGRQQPGSVGRGGWQKPISWYEKTVYEKEEAGFGMDLGEVKAVLSACSRECIAKAAKSHGVHSLVLPV